MIPPTKNGLPALVCISALQKCIRRGMEREAMEFAVELLHTSKAFCSMVTKRLEVISHEDIDTQAAPHVVPFVRTCCEQARAWYESDSAKLGKSRMAIGNAIRMMARAPKSREGDHFQAAIGWRALLEGFKPTVPDWVYDQHTSQGKRMGRGVDHFLTESTKLVPEPKKPDVYAAEAHRLWKLKEQMAGSKAAKQQSRGREQFDLELTLPRPKAARVSR